MRFEEYAAQQAQELQQEPQAQEVLTNTDIAHVAAKLDAEKLYSLMAQMQAAIDEQASPSTMLNAITGAMFGTNSPQAAAVEAIIDADRNPGGHELAIAGIRQQRRMLRQQAKQLDAQMKAITDEITRLDAAERELTGEQSEAAALDTALIDTLTICKNLDPQQPGLMRELETLYEKHGRNPAAMGLLYGSLAELTRRNYAAGELDLEQQQRFNDLKQRIAGAVEA